MFLVGILSWWYSDGVGRRFEVTRNRLASLLDFFSVRLLISTLFSPYRQISAGQVSGSIDVHIRAFFDRTFSRLVGATVRLLVIIVGIVAILAQVVFGVIVMIFWLILPFFPVFGLILMVLGWMPLWTI